MKQLISICINIIRIEINNSFHMESMSIIALLMIIKIRYLNLN